MFSCIESTNDHLAGHHFLLHTSFCHFVSWKCRWKFNWLFMECSLVVCARCVFSCLCSPLEPHQDACSWLLSESNKRNFALISALPSAGIRQIRIHWLLNTVTLNSQWVLKTLMADNFSVKVLFMSCYCTSVQNCYFILYTITVSALACRLSLVTMHFINRHLHYITLHSHY